MVAPDLYEVPIVTQPVTNRRAGRAVQRLSSCCSNIVCIAAATNAAAVAVVIQPGNEGNYAVMQMPSSHRNAVLYWLSC